MELVWPACCAITGLRCWKSIVLTVRRADLEGSSITPMQKTPLVQCSLEEQRRFQEQSGAAEAMRVVSVARRSAVKAKTQAINQVRALLVSAPQDIRERLLKTKTAECVASCARLRSLGETPLLQTLTVTLRLLAQRWLTLEEERKGLDATLERLTTQHARRLRARFSVGPQTAAVLIAVAGDNPERLKSEAALAARCGTSPLQASSGKTVRHRLNRGGNRAANNALWTIAMVRMRSDFRTRAYVERRLLLPIQNRPPFKGSADPKRTRVFN